MKFHTAPTVTTSDTDVTTAYTADGVLIGRTVSWFDRSLDNSERYVAEVIWSDEDGIIDVEEIDIDVRTDIGFGPMARRDAARLIAEQAARDGLVPGWSAIDIDGPMVGLY